MANRYATHPGGNQFLFIRQKNVSVLMNLLQWVIWAAPHRDQKTGRPIVTGIPLLVIDDEADFASIDTKAIPIDENGNLDPEHDPTKIKKLVRNLLHSFEKSAYVGYTATPFANTFIHENARTEECGRDLFPRDFIHNLPAPSNYIGPVRVFGLEADADAGLEGHEGLPVVRPVDDFSVWMPDNHKKEHIPGDLPPSLRESILAFALVCAARIVRGQGREHNTMLVHVTRFTAVQARVADQVSYVLQDLRRRLRHGEGNAPTKLVDEMRGLWVRDFVPTSAAIDESDCPRVAWNQVQKRLFDAVSRIEVRKINGTVKDILDYSDQRVQGISVIAIGGDKLSRGLTLEGLSVSYYLRATRMYDTLMQMGRWFGYRPGYLDLCRLYTSPELIDWYEYITLANEELRSLFDQMAAAGGSPRDFGIRVRSHPDLLITGPVKMRNGHKLSLSFAGDISETIAFHRDGTIVNSNFDCALKFIESLGSPDRTERSNLVWDCVPAARVVDAFLGRIKVHEGARKVRPELLRDYISGQLSVGELVQWTVALISNPKSKKKASVAGHDVGLIERRPHPDERSIEANNVYRIRRLVSPVDEMIDLDEARKKEALENTRKAWSGDRGRYRNDEPPDIPSGEQIRKLRSPSRGLLLLYPLAACAYVNCENPVIGFALSFPQSDSAVRVEYTVNNTYWKLEYADSEPRGDLEVAGG